MRLKLGEWTEFKQHNQTINVLVNGALLIIQLRSKID